MTSPVRAPESSPGPFPVGPSVEEWRAMSPAERERYADLGIPEYFVYDMACQRLLGYRLSGGDGRRYERIAPQAGRLGSAVLGLDVVIQGGTLQFLFGTSALLSSDGLIKHLSAMVDALEARVHDAGAGAHTGGDSGHHRRNQGHDGCGRAPRRGAGRARGPGSAVLGRASGARDGLRRSRDPATLAAPDVLRRQRRGRARRMR